MQGLIKIGPLGLKGDRKGSSYQNPEDWVERATKQELWLLSEGDSQSNWKGGAGE